MNPNNKSNKFINRFKILYEKDLSSIPIIKRKKKNKKKDKNSKINKSEENKPEDVKGKNIEKNITNIKKVRIKIIFKMKKVKKMTIKLNLKKLNFKMVKFHKLMIQNLTRVKKKEIMFVEENKPQNNIENEVSS